MEIQEKKQKININGNHQTIGLTDGSKINGVEVDGKTAKGKANPKLPTQQALTDFNNGVAVPYNLELEAALIGGLLRNNDLFSYVAELIPNPDYFYHPLHRQIFKNFLELTNRGQLATPATMHHLFKDDEWQDMPKNYLNDLASNVPSLLNISEYAKLIRDLFRKRQLIFIGGDMLNRAYDTTDPNATAEKQIEEAEKQLFQLAEYGEIETSFNAVEFFGKNLIGEIEKRRQSKDQYAGIPTGFVNMDDLLGGLNRSDLFILAARPAMGKTAFAVSLACQVAGIPLTPNPFSDEDTDKPKTKEPKGVLFFSLEMSAEQLTNRILCQMTGVSSISVRRRMADEDFAKFCLALKDLRESKFYIDDTPALSITALRQRARRAKRKMGRLDLIIVDYLQLLQPSGLTRHDNRVAEVTEISRGLKIIAKELHVPLIALSQLSRETEKRGTTPKSKMPQLSDLRDSGSIEQDADIVAFLFREEYYLQNDAPRATGDELVDEAERKKFALKLAEVENIAELNIAKHRHGPTDKLRFHFNAITSQFTSLFNVKKPNE